MKPLIDYKHVLRELSVNRDDPCEVVRELVSNAYDASATRMWLLPTLDENGLIFIDNGTGISASKKQNGILPWEAFFSIGLSTKTRGTGIGYKCQGSKLCFAARRFLLLTKCEGGPWQYRLIDNPKTTLSTDCDISPLAADDPVAVLKTLFDAPSASTTKIVEAAASALEELKSGTLVAFTGFEAEDCARHFDLAEPDGTHSYLRAYLRFSTRVGDVRIVDSGGFAPREAQQLESIAKAERVRQVSIWKGDSLESFGVGYQYLMPPDNADGPEKLSRLRDGRFAARKCRTIRHAGNSYALSLAVDGNRRALENYVRLDRRGRHGERSGVKYTHQRGAFACSQGVKICPINWIFDTPDLSEYAAMAMDDGQVHYTLFVHGDFDLVTNRNSLTERSVALLKSQAFLKLVKKFLDDAAASQVNFRELVRRLRRDTETFRMDRYIEHHNAAKESLRSRERFEVKGHGFDNRLFVTPAAGDETWVASLYFLFAMRVAKDLPFSHLWRQLRTLSNVNIDSLATTLTNNSLKSSALEGIEFKVWFSKDACYNHPFTVTSQIVCWDFDDPADGTSLSDDYEYFGFAKLDDELERAGFWITQIESQDGACHDQDVLVVSLRRLLQKTFGATFRQPPPNPKK